MLLHLVTVRRPAPLLVPPHTHRLRARSRQANHEAFAAAAQRSLGLEVNCEARPRVMEDDPSEGEERKLHSCSYYSITPLLPPYSITPWLNSNQQPAASSPTRQLAMSGQVRSAPARRTVQLHGRGRGRGRPVTTLHICIRVFQIDLSAMVQMAHRQTCGETLETA
ncbi:uncharacterized protein BP5553_07026 [Venustampulla echinocandica]|uniref:Uncharacterized protein n=1 Tax=Venustampulla echinocandica TaxID=2656787 RepID=A0A370TIB9_9HELO|nr:uncharacterized protein BP5553_07026 [Venustampulla echinocandica]RDL35095.1 hypothetical protein BP5553_07026 [Venustampulla echinocandica]